MKILPVLAGALLFMSLSAAAQEPDEEDKAGFVEMKPLSLEDARLVMTKAVNGLRLKQAYVESQDDVLTRADGRRIFLRVFAPGGTPIPGMGASDTIAHSLSDALVDVLSSSDWRSVESVSGATVVLGVERAHLQVLPVIEAAPIPHYDPFEHTLAMTADELQMAVTPIDYLTHNHSHEKEVARATKIIESAREGRLDYVAVDLYVQLPYKDEVVRLWRGQAPPSRKSASLEAASDLATRYMSRSQRADGAFPPVYWPLLDVSMSRMMDVEPQALAVFALCRYARHTGSDKMTTPLERAVTWLAGQVSYPPDKKLSFMCVRSEANHVTTAAAALTIMALDEYALLKNTRLYDSTIIKLGEFLEWMTMTTKEGEVVVRDAYYLEADYDEGTALAESYPVETIPALIRVYQRTGRKEWLDLACKVAQFSVKGRENLFKDVPLRHPGWLVMGLCDLARTTGDTNVYNNLALTACQRILERQCAPDTAPFNEYAGGVWDADSPARQEAVPVELGEPEASATADALMGLFCLQRSWPADSTLPESVGLAVVGATRFLIAQQFTDVTAFYAKTPQRCVGGVRRNWANCEIPLEAVARAIIAMSYEGAAGRPAESRK